MNKEPKFERPQGNWRPFVQLLWQHRPAVWIIVVAFALGLGETVLSLWIPLLTMEMVDSLSTSMLDIGLLVQLGVVFLLQMILYGMSMYMMSYVGQFVVARLRNQLWQHVLRLPVRFFDQHPSGETMSRVTHDTNVIKDFIMSQVVTTVSGIVSVGGAVILLLTIDWRMTLLMLLAVPISLLILWPLGVRMFVISKQMQDEAARFQGDLGRVLSEIRLVKASLSEQVEQERGEKRVRGLFHFGLREAKILSIVSPMMMSVMLLVLALIIGYGGVRVSQGTLAGGALVAIILYLFQIIIPFTQMASFFTMFQKAVGASERIREILQEDVEGGSEVESAVQAHPQHVLGSVTEFHHADDGTGRPLRSRQLVFDQVSFGYAEDQLILRQLSFTAEAGQMTAIVGPSGAGKTTVFSLIERFYEPVSGAIYFGEQAVADLSLPAWRKSIAYVSQDSPMMFGTFRDNLCYGLGEVDEEKLKQAVQQANLESFIASLPDQYDTAVGERGVKLSGGQRQRLAIARAILRDPDILLLDEATAHLDSESEFFVQEALQELMHNRTTLVIAHRLSTIRHADKIIVLEQGEKTGEGSHTQLLHEHALYQKLVSQQRA